MQGCTPARPPPFFQGQGEWAGRYLVRLCDLVWEPISAEMGCFVASLAVVGAWGHQLPSGVVRGGPRVTRRCHRRPGSSTNATGSSATELAKFPGWVEYWARDLAWGARPGPRKAPQSLGFSHTKAKPLQCPGGPPCLQPGDQGARSTRRARGVDRKGRGTASKTFPSTKQRGADQPNPRRTKFGHGTFCGIRSAVRLGLQLPSIFRRRRRFFGGFGLLPSQVSGGGVGVSAPSAPAIFAQLVGGRGPLGLPATRRAKWAKKWFALGSWRHSEISSRRAADRAAT
jgi:hypothetical protein